MKILAPASASASFALAAALLAAGPAAPASALGPLAAPLAAQQTGESAESTVLDRDGYLQPPDEVRDAVLAAWHENAEPEDPSPDGRWFVVEVRDRRMPPLALFAKRHHHMAGLQVDPMAKRVRGLTTSTPDRFEIMDAATGERTRVQSPAGSRVSDPAWSPDGSRLAFLVHTDDATHVYVADPATGESRRVTPRPVLATLVEGVDWTADGSALFTVLVPADMGAEPAEPEVPASPRVSVTTDQKNQLRTYPDLLDSPHEAELLEHYATGQLARIDVETGEATEVGDPAMIAEMDASPDGAYVRVVTMEKPFPNIVPYYNFARTDALWDAAGTQVAVVQEIDVDDSGEGDDGPTRREIAWRPDGSGLGFLEREPRAESGDDADGADAEETDDDEPRMDRIYRWAAPFGEDDLEVLHETEHALDDLAYGSRGELIFVTEEDSDEDVERILAIDADDDDTWVVASHDAEDAWDDPGTLVTRSASPDAPVVRVSSDGDHVYLAGTVYSEEFLENAPRPFLDRVEIESGDSERLFESPSDAYHELQAVLDDDAGRLLVSRETRSDVPDFFVQAPDGSGAQRLTQNRNHAPDITGARREAVWAIRADGVRFKVEVALPVGYTEGERVPALFWHYPREYESEDEYREDVRDFNLNAFPGQSPTSKDALLRMGYAVVEPDVPIVGPRRSWNDLYVLHLRNSLSAAIDALDDRGWIDRDRLAIGGHSYGGFGTINAMIQTPFFKAGIAGAANSNRTLTPSGFQYEQRLLWEARETYTRMSPLLYMNELSGALLLYHGQDDQNVGTFPDHSLRSFHAANTLGKTAALYMYPYEAHGQRAEETILDMWTRWAAWLEEYVKGEGDAVPVTE